ncbi:hypothetical protein [Hymenobacter arizonensis]|uniref:Uncharacterized protein n=1 Tax=Hymenobacter arizonensis TaxID=1227077 RepID=A0A1I6BMN6_HYMAR|nr:hypothetical protein [Hymenobacter arizonensis]SFQ82171.1 hypothetical protein SAMN04515668_4751 [Hymenobacter arizonensis]
MSFTISLTGVTSFQRIPFLHPNKKTALAYNALATVLAGLEAVSHRLHERVLVYSAASEEDNRWFNVQVAISEVWEIMDAMRRAQRFWPFVKLSGADVQTRRIMGDIKDIRDSFQHLDERLEHYFQNAGDSVFGDIYWRYRSQAGANEEVFTWATGVTRGPADFTKAKVQPNDVRFLNCTGVYDFNLIYIKREPGQKGNKIPKHAYIQVSLDEAADIFNRVILQLEQQSTGLLQQWQREHGPDGIPQHGLPPIVIRLRSHQEGNQTVP